MIDFYELSCIQDILKRFKVKNIVITDLHNKKLIREILDYDAHITAISNGNPHGFNLEIIEDVPINVLPNLSNYDAIFIDDDPNWYTVFNQLNIVKNTNKEFPLVFICNNKFPHKRRDTYFNPENIPKEFRQEFTLNLPISFKGKEILIQDNFYHAVAENSVKNGVSTAIEDFLEYNSEISFMDLHLVDEITILYPKSTISQIRIDHIKRDIKNKHISNIDVYSIKLENQILLSYIFKNNVSIDNLEEIGNLKVEILEKNELIHSFENKIKVKDNELEYKNSKIDGTESIINLKQSEIKKLQSKLVNKDVKIKNLNNQIAHLETNLSELESHVRTDEYSKNKLQDRINVIQGVFNSFENQIDNLIEDKKNTFNKLVDIEDAFNVSEKKLYEAKKSIDSLKNENYSLNSKLHNNAYSINCFKEKISSNMYEIDYMRNNGIIKGVLSPLSYLILLLKSKPNELSLNIKLYKILKDSTYFDRGFYLKNNIDIIDSGWYKYFSPELHYVCNGFIENRKFNKKYFNRNSKKELLQYLSKCEEQ